MKIHFGGACPFVFLALVAAAPSLAQVRAGGEFRVNTYTSLNQEFPSVAADGDGNSVVVWHSTYQSGNLISVYAQRYDATGAPRGTEFRLSSNTQSRHFPSVASDPVGNFVVAWSGFDGSDYGIFAQRFSATGAPLGAELQVNTYTTLWQTDPDIAADSRGNFVIVWQSQDQDGSSDGVFGQRYDAGGARRGGEFRVNTHTTFAQFFPAVASDADGDFVVTWSGGDQNGTTDGVFAQRYDAAGTARGGEFRVNTSTTSRGYQSDVASDPSGNFVVAWVGGHSSEFDIFAQRYDASGAALGGEFRVNTFTTDFQQLPALAIDPRGNFVVTWASYFQEGSRGVFAQRFDANGMARGAEFHVNTYTTQSQGFPGVPVASDDVGNFVVAWASMYQDGSRNGVFGQRFGGLRPQALDVDTSGNHVLEPGESVDLRPSWRNSNGAPLAFSATLSSMSGPAGATYAITDGVGDYGTVADGAAAACTDCYGVSVSNPATRPAVHWDASAVEKILPDTLGQQKQWSIHVGNSFADVSPASGFYRFIETLLHHGVTAGCTATDYCPSSSTTRAQMAVFVLVAKEGAGYTPPACGTPMFADVPASSPFCRWIEELARRTVVGGCGGSSYCPSASVTREQMAVFVLRTVAPGLNPPACGTPMFNDVPASSAFCPWIEELARRNVVTGCGGGSYCPGSPVTREQMGVFISLTFGLTLYGP